MLRRSCKCGMKSSGKKPVPRFPSKKENKSVLKPVTSEISASISTLNPLSDQDNVVKSKSQRINRYRWILTRMPSNYLYKSSIINSQKYLGGFLGNKEKKLR